jgi:hypothetical protein
VTLAPGDDKSAWLASLAEGQCVVAGREIGLAGLVGQMYRIVGQYYRHFGNPEERARMTPITYLAAAGFVPICLSGVPLLATLKSYLETSRVSRVVSRSLTPSEEQIAAPSGALHPTQEAPEV